MSTVTTFGAFTMARLGIYTSSKAMDVVGNNIANINTAGYTRQKVEQASLYLGGSDRYVSSMDARIGQGAVITTVSQLRDPYLDIRYRNESTNVGAMDQKMYYLEQLAGILDEVGMGTDGEGVIEAQFNDLITQMENLVTEGAGSEDKDNLVRESAKYLTELFNKKANDLQELLDTETKNFKELTIPQVNEILKNIQDLTAAIRKSDISGNPGLELRDSRNVLIDRLAEYMKIDVTYDMEEIGDGKQVERLNISTATYPKRQLVAGVFVTQLSIRQVQELDENGDPKVDADGNPVMVDDPMLNLDLGPLTNRKGDILETWKKISPVEVRYSTSHFDSAGDAQDAIDAAGLPTTEERNGVTVTLAYTPVSDASGATVYQYVPADQTLPANQIDLPEHGPYDDAAAATAAIESLMGDGTLSELVRDGDALSLCRYEPYELNPGAPDTGFGIRRIIVGQDCNEQEFTLTKSEFLSKADAENAAKQVSSTTELLADGTKLQYAYKAIPIDARDETRGFCVCKYAVSNGAAQLGDTEIYGRLQADREMLVKKGEYSTSEDLATDPRAATKRGIPYYQKALDTLAYTFAKVMNEANTFPDTDEYYEDVPGEGRRLKAEYSHYKSGVLFSTSSDNSDPGTEDAPITASNISISNDWSYNRTRLLQTKQPVPEGQVAPSTASDNLSHILSLLQTNQNFDTGIVNGVTPNPFFVGTFQQMYTENMTGNLAMDQRTTEVMLQNYSTLQDDLYVDRESVSGVDLNDEAMNMMQYQKTYSAACRLMTVVDELLDKLINGTAV